MNNNDVIKILSCNDINDFPVVKNSKVFTVNNVPSSTTFEQLEEEFQRYLASCNATTSTWF